MVEQVRSERLALGPVRVGPELLLARAAWERPKVLAVPEHLMVRVAWVHRSEQAGPEQRPLRVVLARMERAVLVRPLVLAVQV